ncbi:hypothetical protein B5F07_08710 [Lachnoclostridium sp. An169]|uniref:DUF6382 domain-containing protein n=1 Tax=Lachnoclostridium sp. An169 TaxID=1965569 RepID=UPI000B388AD7|nr:DUF6382 domain-containing protein [Lachnoclostridium sp. An169]OUP84207.1 hypothetical protein B5F07_08710 [Lachnoclostridium sp. An169]
MNIFNCVEENGKTYLIYEKKPEEKLDRLTLEMLENNQIPGTVPVSFSSKADEVRMKYEITGLGTLKEYLAGEVKRNQILAVIEAIADVVITGGDYMLLQSSYILDESTIFVNPQSEAVVMIVVPVERIADEPCAFFRKLLFDLHYDQSEDCSFVAALLNFLGAKEKFSFDALKKEIFTLCNETLNKAITDVKAAPVTTGEPFSDLQDKKDSSEELYQQKNTDQWEDEDDSDETVLLGEETEAHFPRFLIHRIKTGETYEIKEKMVRIGRSPSVCEICLLGNRGIGRIHAILHVNDGNVYIEDNGSKNKTYLDGEQIIPGEKPKILHSGAKLRLGNEELEFEIC